MSKPPARRWYDVWRRAPAADDDDAADYGTAFGLDMSLTEPAPLPMPEPVPQATIAASAPTLPVSAAREDARDAPRQDTRGAGAGPRAVDGAAANNWFGWLADRRKPAA